jgi:hypothetical protein
VPSVIEKSPQTARTIATHQKHADESEDKAQPLAPRDLLTEGAADHRSKDRLRVDDQCGKAGGHAKLDRAPDAAEVTRLDGKSCDGDVDCIRQGFRPGGAAEESQRAHQGDDAKIARAKKEKRRRVRQAETRDDVARRPDDDEGKRNRANAKIACRGPCQTHAA